MFHCCQHTFYDKLLLPCKIWGSHCGVVLFKTIKSSEMWCYVNTQYPLMFRRNEVPSSSGSTGQRTTTMQKRTANSVSMGGERIEWSSRGGSDLHCVASWWYGWDNCMAPSMQLDHTPNPASAPRPHPVQFPTTSTCSPPALSHCSIVPLTHIKLYPLFPHGYSSWITRLWRWVPTFLTNIQEYLHKDTMPHSY